MSRADIAAVAAASLASNVAGYLELPFIPDVIDLSISSSLEPGVAFIPNLFAISADAFGSINAFDFEFGNGNYSCFDLPNMPIGDCFTGAERIWLIDPSAGVLALAVLKGSRRWLPHR